MGKTSSRHAFRIEGACDACKRWSSDLREVREVQGVRGFFSVVLRPFKRYLCPDCIMRVQFFVDEGGFVRENRITKEESCTIIEEMGR